MAHIVLVVDDEDELFIRKIRDLFRNTGPYIVVAAGSWREGYDRALQYSTNLRLLIVDQVLDEGRRGTHLVRLIRNHQPLTPIVLVTADDNDAVMDEAQKAGATAFFPKSAVIRQDSAISRTFIYWAHGGLPAGHLDRLTTFIQAFAHRSRGSIDRFKLANGAGFGSENRLKDIDTSEIDRLDAEYERIVDIYRGLEGRRLENINFDVCELVAEELSVLDSKNRQFRFSSSEIFILADRELVRLALREVLDNAVKYSSKIPSGHTSLFPIDVGIERVSKATGVFCKISIRDYGQGIDEEDLGLIHNPYVRGLNSIRTNTHGSGLGLHLVRQVLAMICVDAVAGYADVFRPHDGGRGTEAELFLPILSV